MESPSDSGRDIPSPESFQERIVDNLSFWGKIKDIARAAKSDFQNASRENKIKIAGFLGVVGYEYGIGNDITTPVVAGRVLDATHGVTGALAAGVAGGAFVGAQQLGASFFARQALNAYPSVTERAYQHMIGQEKTENRRKTFSELPKLRQWMYSFFLGSSFIVPREAFATGRLDARPLKVVGRTSAAISSASVAMIAAGVGIGEEVAPNNNHANLAFDFIKNPLTWAGIATGLAVRDIAINRRRRRKASEEALKID